MSQECVVAVYESFAQARDAVQALEKARFPSDQVSFVTHSVENEVPGEDLPQYGDKARRNAAKGAGMGGLLGTLLGTPLVTVTGIGAILIAGPVAMGLTGAIVGGFLGAMSGWGVSAGHVRRYEEKVKEGALLVIVNGAPQDVARAEKILQQSEAEAVHLHARTSADTVEP